MTGAATFDGAVGDSRFAGWTNRALKAHAAHLVAAIEHASSDVETELLVEIALLRDEMIDRLEEGGSERGSGGVREPRPPCPSGGATGAAFEPDPRDKRGAAPEECSEVTNAVGDALRARYSQEQFFTERMAPLLKSIAAVLAASALDEASIRHAAGTG